MIRTMMRRIAAVKASILAPLVLLGVCGLVVLFLRFSGGQVAAPAEEGPELLLKVRVNNRQPEFLLGTGLWIEAWIANETAAKTFNENQFRKAEGLPPLPTPTPTIGSPETAWWSFLEFHIVRLGWGGDTRVLTDVNWRDLIPAYKRRITPVQQADYGSARITWVIPPAVCAKLSPGRYRLAATFDTRSGAPQRVAKLFLRSPPAEFRLKRASTDAERAAVMLSEGRWAHNYEDDIPRALKLAKQAQNLDPDSIEAHKQLAMLYASLGRYREAINEYTVYLRQLQAAQLAMPTEDSDADVVRGRIQELRRAMEQQEPPSPKSQ